MTEQANAKNSFVMYCDWEDLFKSLDNNEQAGQLIQALFAFARRGEIAEFTGALKMAFLFMSSQIERDSAKYKRICERRAEYGKKGGLAKASISKQKLAKASKSKQKLANLADTDTVTDTDTDTVTDTVTDTDTDTDILSNESINNNAPARVSTDKPCSPRFIPPTVKDVQAYCAERKNGIDAQHFVDYYTANGWIQGRGKPLKDWRAAVRSWEHREKQEQPGAARRAPDPQQQHGSIDMQDVAKLINNFEGVKH